MANLAPPATQKAGQRPISFLLDGFGSPSFVDLVIRPEDLVRTDPSRLNVQQTLGGAWADNFGPGISQITISGHTGWRRTEGNGEDGIGRFLTLKETVFTEWHQRRDSIAKSGLNPDGVRLVFSDALDDFAAVVAPMSFTLRRSRSRPLLAQYQLAMMVLGDAEVIFGTPKGRSTVRDPDLLEQLGLESLSASVDRITAQLNNVHSFVDGTLAAPVRAFMAQTAKLYGSVRGLISAGSGIVGSVISIAQMTAQAGVNLFRTLAAIQSIPQTIKSSLMSMASAYSNIACVLNNAVRQQIHYQDYSDLYGASNCSSTAGGRPISSIGGENPFYKVVPTAGPSPVSVSQPAHAALTSMANTDTSLAPMSTANLGAAMSTIAGGFAVA